jgi:16S rRNA (guanine527-N7)-methyltransferase
MDEARTLADGSPDDGDDRIDPDRLASRLHTGAAALGLELQGAQVDACLQYLLLLCEWNRRFNLTAVERPDDIIDRHFVDSLSCSLAVDFSSQQTLLDVGTGAGFPGLVLKIAYPHLRVTLLDSLRKRVGFLTRVIEALSLSEVRVLHSRAEDAALASGRGAPRRSAPPATPNLREQFDLVTARAVARMNVLSEWTLPFARVGGAVLVMKGPDVFAEVTEAGRAIRLLGGGEPVIQGLTLPQTEVGRSLVRVPKIRPTPPAYPRLPGSARRAPL